MWRKVDIYNAFLLNIVELLRGDGRDIDWECGEDKKMFRLYARVWDKLTHAKLINRITYLQIIFQFRRSCDMEINNPESVFFKRISGSHLEYPDLYKARGPNLPLAAEVFQPSKRYNAKNQIASCDVIYADNISAAQIAIQVIAAMKHCGEKWSTAARRHAAYLEYIRKSILELLN